jgi:hypothetical protein
MTKTAMTSDRFQTLHPDPAKNGVRIDAAKYELMKRALLKVIPRGKRDVAFRELRTLVEPHLDPAVFGPDDSRAWYVTVVKQDLEARGRIEQVPGRGPQRLRRR